MDVRFFGVTDYPCPFERSSTAQGPGLGPGNSCGKPNWVQGIALIGTYTWPIDYVADYLFELQLYFHGCTGPILARR